jgi:ABC-type transport system involved in multi-copper enzyme maturation permease subunit
MLSDTLLLAQSIKITNWLTPVWIMSVGISIGYLLVLLMLGKLALLQRVPGFNGVAEKKGAWAIAGGLLSLAYVALFLGFVAWQNGRQLPPIEELYFPLVFILPTSLLIGFGAWKLISRRSAGELADWVGDGFLAWVNKVCWTMLAISVLGFGLALVNGFGLIKFVDEPFDMMRSLSRLPFTGTFSEEFQIEPSADNHSGDPLAISFNGRELYEMKFDTNRSLEVSVEPITADLPVEKLLVIESTSDEPPVYRQRTDREGAIPLTQVDTLYVNNLGSSAANLNLTWTLAPVYPEVYVIPVIAAIVVAIYLFYLIFAAMAPKVAAIAFSTFKTEVGQPLFLVVGGLGGLLILLTIFVPYNTFGEDIKMYKDSGLTLIRVLAIFLAIWAASKSVAEEIEGRTALTVLSKPVGRRQFVLGKFTGISLAIAIMFILLGLWFYLWVSYKPVYDAQENSTGMAEWSECFKEAIHVMPGLFLCFLEVLLFVAISVAISTRMGILGNFLICFSIYVLGHLTPLIVQSSLGAFETVAVFGQFIAIIFPVLNHFDVQAAINTNVPVPLDYLGWAVIYTGLYGTMAMLLALVLFEDRDLA